MPYKKFIVFLAVVIMLFSGLSMVLSENSSLANNNSTASTSHMYSSYSKSQANKPSISNLSPNMNNKSHAMAINPDKAYNSEPAPMGLADYGITDSSFLGIPYRTAYEYNTSSFLGIANINSLYTDSNNSSINRFMTFQFNVNLVFYDNSTLYVYWVQDVAFINTSTNEIYFIDNVWNVSSSDANMHNSTVTGNGTVANSSGTHFYYSYANSSLPGDCTQLKYPAKVEFMINSTVKNNKPEVNLIYNDGYGWVTYDNILFTFVNDLTHDSGFQVNGYNYEPDGYSYYDAELILGGPGDSTCTTDINSNVNLSIQYWNNHNYQEIRSAYNFGSDTAEDIKNVESNARYFIKSGSLFEDVTSGAGSLEHVYNTSNIAFLNISMPFSSGTVDVNGNPHSFVNNDINMTLAPGLYNITIYHNGILYKYMKENLTAGEYLPINSGLNKVTFTETGLLFGTTWKVILNGTTIPSNKTTIIFYENDNSCYDYEVYSSSYNAIPATGSFDLNESNINVPIDFKIKPYEPTPIWAFKGAYLNYTITVINESGKYVIHENFNIISVDNSNHSIEYLLITSENNKKTSIYYNISWNDFPVAMNSSLLLRFNSRQETNDTTYIYYSTPVGDILVDSQKCSYSYGNLTTYISTYSGVLVGLTMTSGSGSDYTAIFYNITSTNVQLMEKYNVTFTETGLPSGITWYVNLTDGMKSGAITTSSYIFSVTNGTYTYTVATSDHIYKPASYTGSVTVNGKALTEAITFTPVTYKVIFTETNLPKGATWYVNLTNSTGTFSEHSTSSTITFEQTNGTYSYTISKVSGYTVSKASGSVSVNGSKSPSTITFKAVKKPSLPYGLTDTELYAIIGVIIAIVAVASVVLIKKKK